MKVNFLSILLSLILFSGTLVAQTTYVGNIQGVSVGTPRWIKLGTLALPQDGYNASITINSGASYNANVNQMAVMEIFIRTSNNSSISNGFGFSAYAQRTGYTDAFSAVKILPNASGVAATAYDIYVYSKEYVGGSSYFVTTGAGSWTKAGILSADPGATAYLVPFSYTVMSDFKVDSGRVGINTPAPAAKLHVTSSDPDIAKFGKTNVPVENAALTIGNATGNTDQYIPLIMGRANSTRPLGLMLIAEADDTTPADNFAAAMVLDSRSKSKARLVNNTILSVNTLGIPLMQVKANGALCVNTSDPKGYMLAVNGSAIFTRVTVKNYGNWPDYVFDKTYQLPTIQELENYISQHSHLPDVPSAKEIDEKGLDLAAMQKIQMQKIEELTLYMIQLNKQVAAQQEIIQRQQELLEKLQKK